MLKNKVIPLVYSLVRSFLHVVIMLIMMSMNGYVIIAIICGYMIGFAIFDKKCGKKSDDKCRGGCNQ